MRWPALTALGMALGLPLAAGALVGCSDTIEVGRLPTAHADHAERALAQWNIAVQRVPAGEAEQLLTSTKAAPTARAVLARLLPPPPPPTKGGALIASPTEARLRAAEREIHALHTTLAALPGVIGVRLNGPPTARRAVVQIVPDAPIQAAEVERLMGPGAHVRIVALQVPVAAASAAPAVITRPSGPLTIAICLLIAMVIGLLVHVRRLRRALGP